MIRTSKNTVNVNVTGINALKDFDTAPGTPAGILIIHSLLTKKGKTPVEKNSLKCPKTMPLPPKKPLGIERQTPQKHKGVKKRKNQTTKKHPKTKPHHNT